MKALLKNIVGLGMLLVVANCGAMMRGDESSKSKKMLRVSFAHPLTTEIEPQSSTELPSPMSSASPAEGSPMCGSFDLVSASQGSPQPGSVISANCEPEVWQNDEITEYHGNMPARCINGCCSKLAVGFLFATAFYMMLETIRLASFQG